MAYPITEHEYTLNGGSTIQDCTAGMDNGDGTAAIPVGNINAVAGQVGVRVKAATGRNASAWLWNATDFTAVVAATLQRTANYTGVFTSGGSWGLTMDNTRRRIYATDGYGAGTYGLKRINADTGAVVDSINLTTERPRLCWYNPTTDKIYVLHTGSAIMTVVDAATFAQENTYTMTAVGVQGITGNAATGKLYTCAGSVQEWDLTNLQATNSPVRTLSNAMVTGNSYWGLSYHAASDSLILSSGSQDKLFKVAVASGTFSELRATGGGQFNAVSQTQNEILTTPLSGSASLLKLYTADPFADKQTSGFTSAGGSNTLDITYDPTQDCYFMIQGTNLQKLGRV